MTKQFVLCKCNFAFTFHGVCCIWRFFAGFYYAIRLMADSVQSFKCRGGIWGLKIGATLTIFYLILTGQSRISPMLAAFLSSCPNDWGLCVAIEFCDVNADAET